MFIRSRCYRSLILLFVFLLAACGSSTPAPTLTAVPTEPPTSTPVPPTPTPVPTNTAVPPTNTPLPTATPQPTDTPAPTATLLPTNTPKPAATKAVTPQPTNTKNAVAPVSTGGGVSSQPSTLATSIEQSHSTTQVVVGLLDQIINGADVSVCAPLIEKYQSLHNAPTYDMSGQSAELQQTYALYRQAIATLAEKTPAIQGCGQGSGTIGKTEAGFLRRTVSDATIVLGKALNLTQRAAILSPDSPLADAIKRVRTAAVYLVVTLQSAGNQACGPFVTEGNVVISAPTYDVSGEPAAVQNAYALYRRAVDLAAEQTTPLIEMCNNGGGRIASFNLSVIRDKLHEAVQNLDQALAALPQ